MDVINKNKISGIISTWQKFFKEHDWKDFVIGKQPTNDEVDFDYDHFLCLKKEYQKTT